MDNISIVVVIYGKELIDSKTLTSLLEFEFKFDSLLIYNNGPDRVEKDEVILTKLRKKFAYVNIVDDITNSPLSKIYNKFLNGVESSFYVILDDDTEINCDYMKLLQVDVHKYQFDLIIPKILSYNNDEQYYPISNGIPIKTDGDISSMHNILSISSGLVINNSIFSKMLLGKNIFDERFAFYGVDTSFFKRITRNKKIKICVSSYLLHSLSRTEGSDNVFRKKERLFDLAISTRCYPSMFNYFYFIKKITMLIFFRDFKILFQSIRVFIRGRHPKC